MVPKFRPNEFNRMHCILRLVVVLALTNSLATAALGQNAGSESTPDAQIVSVMSRMTIVVADADASKRFYSYALGYEVVSDSLITNPVVKTQMGIAQDRTVRFVILRSSHMIAGKRRDGAQIGLIQVGNPALPVMRRPPGADLASGEAMMAMRTTDIKLAYARLKELGARILLEPMVSPDGRETELVVHDPDGVRIHVVQRPDREVADRPVDQQPK